jgi:hypothetical protein
MRTVALGLMLLLPLASSVSQAVQDPAAANPQSGSAPLYRISFKRGDAIPSLAATPAIKLPFECTGDGTIFISFISTTPANIGTPPPPPIAPPMVLTSASPEGVGHTFRLDRVPELHISSEVDHYASDSEVVFLVRASREIKPIKRTYSVGSYQGEYTSNAAEQHLYILAFSREGEYLRAAEIEQEFSIQRLGAFPSGALLAFGFGGKDHSPKLVMLKEDGALLKSLEIPSGDAPEQLGVSRGRGFTVAQSDLVTVGRSIIIVQNKTTFPLLEVSEGGAVRAIHPKLPDGDRIETVIPSDRGLYLIAVAKNEQQSPSEVIYEANPASGAVMRRFELSDLQTPSDMACIHDGKFLSIDYSDGKVVPLVGSTEPAVSPQK